MNAPVDNTDPGGGEYRNAPSSELDRRREDIVARLRASRAIMAPKAAVTAAASSSAEEGADLQAAVSETAPVPTGFEPRSMTMKLILARPDVTMRVLVGLIALLLGSRMASRVGSLTALIQAFRSGVGSVRQ